MSENLDEAVEYLKNRHAIAFEQVKGLLRGSCSAEDMLSLYIGFRQRGMDEIKSRSRVLALLRNIGQPFRVEATCLALASAEADFIAAGSPSAPYPEYRQKPHRPRPALRRPEPRPEPQRYNAFRERNKEIAKAHADGETLKTIGARYGICRDRVRQIWVKEERMAASAALREEWRRQHWRPVILSGHHDFNDPYGVDQVSTPRDVYLDDRFMLGKEVGP